MSVENKKIIKLFMPVTKDSNGKLIGILSDDSMDRDDEFMSKELIETWSQNKSLKALVNHENKMEKWVGGWKNLNTINKGKRTALTASPWFFSKEANPLAAQTKKQVEEAIERGESPGISIGAMPIETEEREIDGKTHLVYTKAELLEATWVPIQSNRNSFAMVAKNFDIELSNKNKLLEEKNMEKKFTQEDLDNAIAKVKKEVEDKTEEQVEEKVESAKTEIKEEAKIENEKVKEEAQAEVDAAKKKNSELEKELKELTQKAVNLRKKTVEGPLNKTNQGQEEVEPTIENFLQKSRGEVK